MVPFPLCILWLWLACALGLMFLLTLCKLSTSQHSFQPWGWKQYVSEKH
jgi:hypothetical protein